MLQIFITQFFLFKNNSTYNPKDIFPLLSCYLTTFFFLEQMTSLLTLTCTGFLSTDIYSSVGDIRYVTLQKYATQSRFGAFLALDSSTRQL